MSDVICDVCEATFDSEYGKNIHKAQLHNRDYPWDDKEQLRNEYIEKGKSVTELSKQWDCGRATVARAVERFGLSGIKETPIGKRVERTHYHTDENGYVRCQSAVGDTTRHVKIHRLIAVAHCGLDTVKDNVVHHKNEIPWDNRPENLEVMGRGEHVTLHNLKRDYA